MLKNNVYSKKSLIGKYIRVSVLIVFFSFLVLGTILTIAVNSYWTNEKHRTLDVRAQNVAEYIRSNVMLNQSLSGSAATVLTIKNADDVTDFLKLFSDDVGVDIIVTNTMGRIAIAATHDVSIEDESSFISTDVVRKAMEEYHYFDSNTLGGMYSSERLVAARPILDQKEQNIMGVAIVTSGKEDISNFTDMVLELFILSALAALAVTSVMIFLFSYRLVSPLKQMGQAVKQFGKGDFSVRIAETSNDEIGELAVAFNNMADSLSSSEVTRKSFVANVSHELKTPMTTISGFVDGILDGTIPEEKHSYYLRIVSDEVKRLSRLVHSMLNLSRLDSGELKLNKSQFDLLSVLVTTLISFEQEINRRHIEIRGLELISPKMVYGDKDLLHQVVYNLIENAVKFTNEGGFIEFSITEDAEKVTFSVKNSGPGIKKNEIPLVFDRFYKTDKSRSQDKKGLGLGLYLVRSIIRLHDGDIQADSVYGKYTEFYFYLPRTERKEKKPGK